MVPQWSSVVASRIVSASTTPLTINGIIGVASSLSGFGLFASVFIASGATSDFIISPLREDYKSPTFANVACTFGRVLVIPSLLEEVVWRVALLPHPRFDGVKMAPLPLLLSVNTCFALYHFLGGYLLQYTTTRSKALETFEKPAFLSLAFMLGVACTWSYYASGGALMAPVLVHAIPVTLWLCCFGGELLLSGEMDNEKVES
jgi:predicted Abi (CAAX) family protease